MKKLSLFVTLALIGLLFTSCRKDDYKRFVGTWGVEKIEYYNVDYAGNPIAGSLETFNYDPNSTDNGIQLIFKADKSGEMRDSAVDTIWVTDDSYIVCPDTTVVYKFSYSFDKSDRVLYMNIDYVTYIKTFKMYIENMTDNSFVYENEYDKDYVERAYLKRISKATSKSSSRQEIMHPRKPGSFLGDR